MPAHALNVAQYQILAQQVVQVMQALTINTLVGAKLRA